MLTHRFVVRADLSIRKPDKNISESVAVSIHQFSFRNGFLKITHKDKLLTLI